MTDISFRIRFNRAPTRAIDSDSTEVNLQGEANKPPLKLKSRNPDVSLEDSDRIALVGTGYSSEGLAEEAAHRFQDALLVALARVRVGADFGNRAAKGMFTRDGLALLHSNTTARVLNDVHGLMVYETEPRPLFASLQSKVSGGVSIKSHKKAFNAAVEGGATLTDRERVSYTLFNASFFQQSADSRLILLVMAVEVILEPPARAPDAVAHVESLISVTRSSSLSDAEKQSMIGSLNALRKESIGQVGRRIAKERLPGRRYAGLTAEEFFKRCYSIRSDLAHGNLPLPTFEEVGSAAAVLEQFVSDLLTMPHVPAAS